jgi:LmbE family N-acetylglucosaminyl deacetylase
MNKILFFLFLLNSRLLFAQAPHNPNSAEILLQLQKLKVLGSVLYIAAHPDDENTRLLAWSSKEKLYRTGYLSITRGDGGQNLIGDEQGIELGLIRTQELLSARRIDGAEQFFTRAYDFGYSKSTEETLEFWNKEKILGDVVWVIRNFRPDIIVTRFPEDNRAGHGQHSASAVLAREAFYAAADPNRFPEQFKYGVELWKPRRIFWNTYNFGGANNTSETQLKIDVGAYNPLVGKSYGEIASDSRSQHKSQGFGFFSSRGKAIEYFQLTGGDTAKTELLEGIVTDWKRVAGGKAIESQIEEIIRKYSFAHPQQAVPALIKLYHSLGRLSEGYWKMQKQAEVQKLIEACSGFYLEAAATQEYAVQGDSLRLNFSLNNRNGVNATLQRVMIDGFDSSFHRTMPTNENLDFRKTIYVPEDKPLTQPYWLVEKMNKASYSVNDQILIGKPGNDPAYQARFVITIEGTDFTFTKPVQYKFRDPVKGELFEPLVVLPPYQVELASRVKIFVKDDHKDLTREVRYVANKNLDGIKIYDDDKLLINEGQLKKGQARTFSQVLPPDNSNSSKSWNGNYDFNLYQKPKIEPARIVRRIQYDHIPRIEYFVDASVKNVLLDIKTDGLKIGYISGAGDKVPEALQQLGYEVSFLNEKDLTLSHLNLYDAVVTGVRAYNVNKWLSSAYDVLMEYVKNGGNLVVQYNTSGFGELENAKLGPFPFVISRNRVTDEESRINFLIPDDPVLNWPNKITQQDFEKWVQERGIYFADKASPEFRQVLGMNDKGEEPMKGSLIVADYGKGRYIYTGLAFFRQLPAGVPGAYRLFVNLIANPNKIKNGASK